MILVYSAALFRCIYRRRTVAFTIHTSVLVGDPITPFRSIVMCSYPIDLSIIISRSNIRHRSGVLRISLSMIAIQIVG